MAMSELKQRLLKIGLANLGFRDARYDAEHDVFIVVPSEADAPIIHGDGDIYYDDSEYDYIAKDQLRPLLKQLSEIIAAWEKAAAVPFEDLSNYRVLAEYNNIVLAARDDSELGYEYGLHFTTWEHDYDGTGFWHGHYTTDYDDAKEDFALRCGLVDKRRLFNATEMRLIRHGLVHLGADSTNLTAEQITLLGKVVERIEMLVPEIRWHEVLEKHALAPDDGLEI